MLQKRSNRRTHHCCCLLILEPQTSAVEGNWEWRGREGEKKGTRKRRKREREGKKTEAPHIKSQGREGNASIRNSLTLSARSPLLFAAHEAPRACCPRPSPRLQAGPGKRRSVPAQPFTRFFFLLSLRAHRFRKKRGAVDVDDARRRRRRRRPERWIPRAPPLAASRATPAHGATLTGTFCSASGRERPARRSRMVRG